MASGSFTSVNRGGKYNSLHEASFPSDSERTRSPSPVLHPNQSQSIPTSGFDITSVLNDDGSLRAPRSTKPPKPPGPGRGNWRRNKNKDATTPSANTPGSGGERPYKPRNLDSNHPALSQLHSHIGHHGGDDASATSIGSSWNPSDPYINSNPLGSQPQPPFHASAAGTPNAGVTPHGGFIESNGHGYFNQPNPNIPYAPLPLIPSSSLSLNSAGSRSRARPQTQHQLRVEQHRQQHVNYILDRRLRTQYARNGRKRQRDGAVLRVWKRLARLPSGYDSAEEEVPPQAPPQPPNAKGAAAATVVLGAPGGAPTRSVEQEMVRMSGVGGLVPVIGPDTGTRERDDWGEEADAWARAIRRFARRFERWEGADPRLGVKKGRSGMRRRERSSSMGADGKGEEHQEDRDRRLQDEGYSSPLGAGEGDDAEAEKDRVAAEAERMADEDDEDDDEDEDREMDEVDGDETDSDGEDDDERMVVDG